MKSVSQIVNRETRRFVRNKIRQELDPAMITAIAESEMQSALADALNDRLIKEQEELLGRSWHERVDEPVYRNGYKSTSLKGIFSSMTLRRPMLRSKTPPSPFLDGLKKTGQSLLGMLASRFWLRGASTRAVADELNDTFGTKLHSAEVSAMTKHLGPVADAWLNKPITDEISYLFLDALYLPARKHRFVGKQAVLVAIGLKPNGHVVALGFMLGDKESNDSWSSFLKELLSRGLDLSKVKMVISDEHKAITSAVEKHLGLPHQLCVVHKIRNMRARIAGRNWKDFYVDFKAIFWAKSRQEAHDAFKTLEDRWGKLYPKAVQISGVNLDRFLTFMDQPKGFWTILRSSNLIERFNRELRRRLRPAGAMQNEDETNKLLWATTVAQQKRWDKRASVSQKKINA